MTTRVPPNPDLLPEIIRLKTQDLADSLAMHLLAKQDTLPTAPEWERLSNQLAERFRAVVSEAERELGE